MAGERYEWIHRIKAVDTEYRAARVALDRLLATAGANPAVLPAGYDLKGIRLAGRNLELTYFFRLFAEFENGVRAAWRSVYHRSTRPDTFVVIERVGALAIVPQEMIDQAQAVRESRNALIHEDAGAILPIPFEDARRRLCSYFSRLPADW